jgi:hypothetical protein
VQVWGPTSWLAEAPGFKTGLIDINNWIIIAQSNSPRNRYDPLSTSGQIDIFKDWREVVPQWVIPAGTYSFRLCRYDIAGATPDTDIMWAVSKTFTVKVSPSPKITTDKSYYTTNTLTPSVIVGYQIDDSDDTLYDYPLYAEELTPNGWENVRNVKLRSNHSKKGDFELFKNYQDHRWEVPAGIHTYRLAARMPGGDEPKAISAEFKVRVNKVFPTIEIGETSHVETFIHRTKKDLFTPLGKTLYYEVTEKVIKVRNLPGGDYRIQLQWFKNGKKYSKWVTQESKTTATTYPGAGDLIYWTIRHYTPEERLYRIYLEIPSDNRFAHDAISNTFRIRGVKNTPIFTLKYSATKLEYNSQKRVKLTIKTNPYSALEGNVTVYDNGKKIGTFTVKEGKGSYLLPKLKKGTHRVQVKFTATAQYKIFYNTKITPVKEIKVV